MASEKDQVTAAEETTNGEKNGDTKEETGQKLSLGEIAAIDEEIAKAKTDQLQLLHNLFYGKNGTGPQIKRNIRKFAGFETDERQKKLDQILTFDLPALQQTVTILDIKDIKPDEEKEAIAKAIIDFLISPTGKTIAEVEKENPTKDEEEEEDGEDEEVDEEEEEEEEEVKPKGSPRKKGGDKNKSGRPKRATASRVWTNDYGSSDDEEVEEAKPKVGRKRKNESDSGSDYNPNASDDSEADRRKSSRNSGKKPTRGRRRNVSESEDEESPSEDDDFSEEEMPKKKKAVGRPKRGATGGAKRGRKRKQETESEEESEPEEEDEDEEMDSDDSEKQKKSRKPTPKSTPQKNSKGRPKRAAPPAKKKKKDESDEEEESEEQEESEDDEPLKKPPKKSAVVTEKSTPAGDGSKAPSDDDIKTLLKDILAEANLEEITMKTVCKKVYAHYPGHDLTQKKDFIKQTVKSLIAA